MKPKHLLLLLPATILNCVCYAWAYDLLVYLGADRTFAFLSLTLAGVAQVIGGVAALYDSIDRRKP